jgi:hypothetical protein
LAIDGLVNPLSFLTNCSDAARISSSVAGGAKLNRVLMLLHTVVTSLNPFSTPEDCVPFSTPEDGVDTGKQEFQSAARDLPNAISEDLPVQSDGKRDIRDGILS